MSLDTALFLVDRDGDNHHVSGADILDTIRVGDKVLVQRDGERFHCAYVNSDWDKIRNDDLLLAWDGTENRMVTGQNFKGLFVQSKPPITESQGFGIEPDKTNYNYGNVIQAVFTGMKPGYTQEDYLSFYKTTSRITPIAANFVSATQPNNDYELAAYWKYDKMKVTADFWEVVLFLDFEDRETGEVTTHSMIATLRKT